MLYAAKIAAARLYAPEHEFAAIVAAMRAEERAALAALRDRQQMTNEARRRKKLGWRFASHLITRNNGQTKAGRPQTLARRRRRRERHKG
jgi:hypothetical protein